MQRIAEFEANRSYERFNFMALTFLYYIGQQPEDGYAYFKAVRVCEADEYELNDKPCETVKKDLDELPYELLERLEYEPETEVEAKRYNNIHKIVLLFDEGTEKERYVILNQDTYLHTSHAVFDRKWGQLNSLQSLRHICKELLDSDERKGADCDETKELEETLQYYGTFIRGCTLIKHDGYSEILSFRTGNAVVRPFSEVAENFLKTTGAEEGELYLTNKECQIRVLLPIEGFCGNKPILILNYSDTGYVKDSIGYGYCVGAHYFQVGTFDFEKDYNYSEVKELALAALEKNIAECRENADVPLTTNPVLQASNIIVSARRKAGLKDSFPGNKILDKLYETVGEEKYETELDLKLAILNHIYSTKLAPTNKALLEKKGANAILNA